VARTRPRIRWLPLLVGAVVALCAVAVLTALLLPSPAEEATPPPAPPAPVAAPATAPGPPSAPPLPDSRSRVQAAVDWSALPVEARDRRRPTAAALLRVNIPRLQACMVGWKHEPGAPQPSVEVTLGLLSTVAGLEVEHVDITGGTVRDAATRVCIVDVLVGNTIPGVRPPVGTRKRVADRLLLPVPPPPGEAPRAAH
jgi:hypothetical protein